MIARSTQRARALLHHRPVRYTLVAGTCAVANNVLLIAGDRLGYGYVVLMAAAWLGVGTLGYLLHARFTFAIARGPASYARFMAGIAAGVPVSWLVLMLGGRVLHLPMWINAPLNTLLMFAYNYANARVAMLWRRRAA